MDVVIFGATGMIGQGVLRECLLDPGVGRVLSVVRRPTGTGHAKLRELVRDEFLDFTDVEADLSGFDACFFCLGVSSTGMSEDAYAKVTRDIPLAAGAVLARFNPSMTFVYVSGAGADASERGRVMWARVKGQAENALRRLPFKACYAVRPAFIQPLHGIRSRTRLYRAAYTVTGPLMPILKRLFPRYVTTTEQLGRAMIALVRRGAAKAVLESGDINGLSDASGGPSA